jgi:hypothetical protein
MNISARMSRIPAWFLLLAMLPFATSVQACSLKHGVTDAQLAVTVQKPSGEPVSGVPISFRTFAAVGAKSTDASGNAVFSCQTGVGDAELFVVVSPKLPPSGDTGAWQTSLADYRQMISDYAFDRFYIVPLISGQTEYSLTIVARPAIRVSGVIADAQGGHPSALVLHAGAVSPVPTGLDGTFTIGGIAKDTASECFVCFNDGTVVSVTIPPSSEDRNLGNINIASRPSVQGLVRLTLTNRMPDEIRREALNGGITLISEDGVHIYTYLASQTGEIKKQLGTDELPQVPPGTYYAAPGAFNANSIQLKLLHALKNQAELAGTPLTQVVVVAGQETVASVDVVQTKTALVGLPN